MEGKEGGERGRKEVQRKVGKRGGGGEWLPRTMMIHLKNAFVAHTTVMGSWRLWSNTLLTDRYNLDINILNLLTNRYIQIDKS